MSSWNFQSSRGGKNHPSSMGSIRRGYRHRVLLRNCKPVFGRCGPATLEHWRNNNSPSLTTGHQIFSKERTAEPKWEHMKICGEARKQLLEVRIICTKISKGSSNKHSMGVKPKYIVVTWIQIPSFDELQYIVGLKK